MDLLNDYKGEPKELFEKWFEHAKKIGIEKPEKFYLASLGLDDFPQVRTVLFKGFVDNCFSFYTNYQSHKAKELAENPNVSALFYWLKDDMDHQIRVCGSVRKMSKEKSEEYFHSRPRGSQIGAWASPQSEKISSREDLDKKVQELEERFAGKDIPLPEFWGGYLIEAKSFEFMILRKDRLHDRFLYKMLDGVWQRERLAP